MMHCHSDTVYKYYSETWGKNRMLDVRCFWYHKNNNIHLYVLQEGKAMRYKKIPAINYAVNDTIDEYKMVTMAENRYGECFEATLDGEGIFVYIKKRKNVDISVNSNCLSKKKCKEGTFEYKLQYDLPRVMKYIKYD